MRLHLKKYKQNKMKVRTTSSILFLLSLSCSFEPENEQNTLHGLSNPFKHSTSYNLMTGFIHYKKNWVCNLICPFLYRFVSDHAPAGCQALLQHRLIQANQKTQLGSGSASETARTYPLSLLEWTVNRKKANMVLHVHCFDGET